MIKRFLRQGAWFPLLILLALPVRSQSFLEPLVGPLVATTPAQQDQILIYDVGGAAQRQLSFGYGEHHMWDFSPDGCRILFTLDHDFSGLPALYSARLDGSDMQSMVAYADPDVLSWGVWEPDWSVKGRIAFTLIRNYPDPREEVRRETHIAWIDEPGPPEFYSVTGSEYTPVWSADGEWLAYVSYFERVPGADVFSTAVPTTEPPPDQAAQELPTVNEADMWVVSHDAGSKYRATAFTVGSVHMPRWSPDGDLIGFIYSPSPNNDTFWMIGSDPNARPTELSSRWNLTLDFTWLPEGDAMLASVRDFQDSDENRLWRIPLVGDADIDASLYLAEDIFAFTDYPRFSGDGRYLAFRNEYSIVVLDLTTNTIQRFAEDLPGNTPPVWSPGEFRGESECR